MIECSPYDTVCGAAFCSRCTKAVGHGWPDLERCQGCDRRLLKDQPRPETRWCQDCLNIRDFTPIDLLFPPEWGEGGCKCVSCEKINNPPPTRAPWYARLAGWCIAKLAAKLQD